MCVSGHGGLEFAPRMGSPTCLLWEAEIKGSVDNDMDVGLEGVEWINMHPRKIFSLLYDPNLIVLN